MLSYLPLASAATAIVIVLPALLVAALLPQEGVTMTLLSALLSVAMSIGLAALGAALWKRQPRSRDVVFAELMLWCWVRRCWTERRLSQARELFEAARKAGPRVNIELLLGLSRLLEARDGHLHGHSQRVARHSVRIARAMGLSPREVAKIRTAAEVHDVGKLYTPREILNSPYPLSDEEFEIVKEHAARGAEMVSVVGDPEITAMVRHHHERIDGGGYPDGLAGSEIPLGARIIAVADTFDAITSDRTYRSAGSQRHALAVLSQEAGAQLDAQAAAAFEQGYSARRSVAWYAAGTVLFQRAALALQSLLPGLGLGGASVGALAPALGAAGVLAVSPGMFRATESAHPASAVSDAALALVQPLRTGTPGTSGGSTGATPGGGRSGGAGEGGQAIARLEPRGSSHGGGGESPYLPVSGPAPAGGGGSAPGSGPSSSAGGGSSGAGGDEGAGGTPGGSLPSPGTPVGEAPEVPSTSSTPSVATPSVSTRALSTPSVSTPSVSVAPVTVPSVTVPSVTVPSVTVPSVSLPQPDAPPGG